MAAIDYAKLQRVIAVANGKGGVLKSSLSANMAGLAAAAGHRVLLVDMDPQGDLSDDLGYFNDERDDQGEGLVAALSAGSAPVTVLTDVRPNLDVIPAGPALSDVSGVLLSRNSRGAATDDLLARTLEHVADQYDLVVIDTPPTDVQLQTLALGAARWLVAPTRSDKSSIRALESIAIRMVETRSEVHDVDLLAVVLGGVGASATRVRASAVDDIETKLGSFARTLVPVSIRSAEAAAKQCRDEGQLAHEVAERVEGAEPYWKALRAGRDPQRLPGSAPALADDYVSVTHHVLQELNAQEALLHGEQQSEASA